MSLFFWMLIGLLLFITHILSYFLGMRIGIEKVKKKFKEVPTVKSFRRTWDNETDDEVWGGSE